MQILILQTGQEGELSDLLGIPTWGCLALVLGIGVVIYYLIIFLLGFLTRKSINQPLVESFGNIKGIELEKNDYGIYDLRGTYKGRRVEIKHLTDIWSKPRRLVIRLGHNISNVSDEITYNGLTITAEFVEEELDNWPEDTKKELNRLISRLTEIEANPYLLFFNDE